MRCAGSHTHNPSSKIKIKINCFQNFKKICQTSRVRKKKRGANHAGRLQKKKKKDAKWVGDRKKAEDEKDTKKPISHERKEGKGNDLPSNQISLKKIKIILFNG